MKIIPLLLGLLLCAGARAADPSAPADPGPAAMPAAKDVIAAVSRFVPSATPIAASTEPRLFFAGHYANPLPGLSGQELYLFPDRSYLFVEWADIWPRSIADKGTWDFADGYIKLTADGSLAPKYGMRDRVLVPITITDAKGAKSLSLLGVPRDYVNFLKSINDPFKLPNGKTIPLSGDLEFLIVAKPRAEPIQSSEADALKAKLMREAWRPERYRE